MKIRRICRQGQLDGAAAMSVTYRRRVRRRTKLERWLAFAAAARPRTVFFTGVYLLLVVGLVVGLTGSQSSAGLGTGSIVVSSTETQLAVTNTGRRALVGVRVYRLGYLPE